jgi:hypothetical protein
MPIQRRLVRGGAGLTLVRAGAIYCSIVGSIMFRRRVGCVRHQHSDLSLIATEERTCPSERTITRSVQRPSVHLGSFKLPPRRLKKNRPKDVKLGACNPLRPIVEHKKSGSSRSFYTFIGKDATDHRRPYTSRMSSRSTPNAGGNGRRRSKPRNRHLPEQCVTRRCRRTSYRH